MLNLTKKDTQMKNIKQPVYKYMKDNKPNEQPKAFSDKTQNPHKNPNPHKSPKTYEDFKKDINTQIQDLILFQNPNQYMEKIVSVLKTLTGIEDTDEYIYSHNRAFALSQDVNEDRIKKHSIFNTLFSNMKMRSCFSDKYFLKISVDPDSKDYLSIIGFWTSMTLKVIKKATLGFPLCMYSNKDREARIPSRFVCLDQPKLFTHLYFLKHKRHLGVNLAQQLLMSNFDEIVFQKLLIFSELQAHNLFSNKYIFEEITITNNEQHAQKYTFKIKDLIFNISFTKLIVLSPLTCLYKGEYKPEDYVNSLDQIERDSLKEVNSSSFIELMLSNFQRYLNKSIYNAKNIVAILQLSNLSHDISIGKVCIMKSSDMTTPTYVIILSVSNTHVKYMVIFDNFNNPKSLYLQVKTELMTTVKEKFYDPNFLFEKNMFENCIGISF